MSILIRRKLGILLVAISVVALVALLVVGVLRGDLHYDGSGSSGIAQWSAYSGELKLNGYYLIPILCGAIGIVCLAWPSRKPPKLNQ